MCGQGGNTISHCIRNASKNSILKMIHRFNAMKWISIHNVLVLAAEVNRPNKWSFVYFINMYNFIFSIIFIYFQRFELLDGTGDYWVFEKSLLNHVLQRNSFIKCRIQKFYMDLFCESSKNIIWILKLFTNKILLKICLIN